MDFHKAGGQLTGRLWGKEEIDFFVLFFLVLIGVFFVFVMFLPGVGFCSVGLAISVQSFHYLVGLLVFFQWIFNATAWWLVALWMTATG